MRYNPGQLSFSDIEKTLLKGYVAQWHDSEHTSKAIDDTNGFDVHTVPDHLYLYEDREHGQNEICFCFKVKDRGTHLVSYEDFEQYKISRGFVNGKLYQVT